ncbi:hypothetical protein PPERSA_11701 [Pseudocohnilembus persalinus]|uniref:Tubulin-tyrosine ligase family protein n=1 Tax=Pseudocohnilembus persalinus TaxID=266149 RepID=A0A0V0Q972_PSEPJ|nr:hypothetical protein PPERSA_11701 [Pseudocohnilembus persalinus]|eukprot:KRW98784.1 hypothetical protein PPERSA_11701 [Pseudocohnilembus persalinus]
MNNQGQSQSQQQQQAQQTKQNPFKFVVYKGNNSKVFKHALLNRGNWEEIINHFENNRLIVTKPGLIRSLSNYYRKNIEAVQKGYGVFQSMGTSFILQAGQEDNEYNAFLTRFKDIQNKQFQKEPVPLKHCQENMWVVKPANLNQGQGIEIFDNLQKKQLNSYWVIQKYIEKPLLYKERKFDIRTWVLVTDKCDIFMFSKGYMRTCGGEYDIKGDKDVHLTNNCLQQNVDSYGKHEPGNTLDLEVLFDYIEELFPGERENIKEQTIARMKDLIIDTILSSKKQLFNNKKPYGIFEFFGFDFLIDEDLRTWLIECNHNPYLGVPNEHIKQLLPKMIDQMVQLVIDPHFIPQQKNEYHEQENLWELIYCDMGSIYTKQVVNQRQNFNTPLYPLDNLAQPSNKQPVSTNYFSGIGYQNQLQTIRQAREKDTKNIVIIRKNIIPKSLGNRIKNNIPKRKYSDDQEYQVGENSVNLGNNLAHGQKSLNQQFQSGYLQPINSNFTEKIQKKEQNMSSLSIDNFSIQSKQNQIKKLPQQIQNQALQKAEENNLKNNVQCKFWFQAIQTQLSNYPYKDFDPYYKYPPLIISKLINWEIIQEQELYWAQKCLSLIINSKISDILVEQYLASCSEKNLKKYDLNVRLQAIECLISLGGNYSRKQYIPGETQENDKLRKYLIQNGGLLALIYISYKGIQEQVRKVPLEYFSQLEVQDFELQQEVLKSLKEQFSETRPAIKKIEEEEDHFYQNSEILELSFQIR